MSEIEWADPPTNGRSSQDWAEVAFQLRANPQRWAKVRSAAKSPTTATQIKQGVLSAFRPAGAFESRTARAEGGRWDIYARFVGEDGAA